MANDEFIYVGLELGAPHNEVFTGLWGFNCFLTGAALGGNLFVINVQTVAATLVAIVYTLVLQYVLRIIFGKVSTYYSTTQYAITLITIRFQIGLPFLTLPFLISTSLFLKLRSASSSAVFPKPFQSSYPEKQRHDYLINRKRILQENVGIIVLIFLKQGRILYTIYLRSFISSFQDIWLFVHLLIRRVEKYVNNKYDQSLPTTTI